MRTPSRTLLFAGTLCCAGFATQGAAQSGAATGPVPTLSAARASAPAAFRQLHAPPSDTVYLVRRKHVVGAGLLSYLYPGMGSFYAGHTRHGVTHTVVALTTLLVLMGGAAGEATGPDASVGSTLMVAYGVNWGWSIVTAVNDARAVNRTAAKLTSPR